MPAEFELAIGFEAFDDTIRNQIFYKGLALETFEELLNHKNIRIERIVSSDQPEGKEYNQDDDEWVVLIKGSATLEMNGESAQLTEGDHLFIPKHTPHRVTQTEAGTIWLAVHIA